MLVIAMAGVEVVTVDVTMEGDRGRGKRERGKQDIGGGEQVSCWLAKYKRKHTNVAHLFLCCGHVPPQRA